MTGTRFKKGFCDWARPFFCNKLSGKKLDETQNALIKPQIVAMKHWARLGIIGKDS